MSELWSEKQFFFFGFCRLFDIGIAISVNIMHSDLIRYYQSFF